MRTKILIENTAKNILLIATLHFFFGPVNTFLRALPYDAINYQTIIVCSSLLIMAFLFGAYGFTYKDSHFAQPMRRLLDHTQSALYLFGCGALLAISYITINLQLRSEFTVMGILMIIFYLSLVLFDFYDLLRGLDAQKIK